MRDPTDPPSPVSASEQLLDRIHNDDQQEREERIEDLRQQLIDVERQMAARLAMHPDCPCSTRREVLERCDYDSTTLTRVFNAFHAETP